MKDTLLTLGLAAIALVTIFIPVAVPSVVFAAHNSINSQVFNPTVLAGPLLVCTGVSSNGGPIGNTCQNLCDLVAQVAQVIYYMIAVVIWIVTPILVAVGGIMIMIGGASPEMVGRGKKTITGAVWGIAIVLCAWLLVKTLVSPITGLGISGIGGFSSVSSTGVTASACGL